MNITQKSLDCARKRLCELVRTTFSVSVEIFQERLFGNLYFAYTFFATSSNNYPALRKGFEQGCHSCSSRAQFFGNKLGAENYKFYVFFRNLITNFLLGLSKLHEGVQVIKSKKIYWELNKICTKFGFAVILPIFDQKLFEQVCENCLEDVQSNFCRKKFWDIYGLKNFSGFCFQAEDGNFCFRLSKLLSTCPR